jgi:FkbM family methyltransferase
VTQTSPIGNPDAVVGRSIQIDSSIAARPIDYELASTTGTGTETRMIPRRVLRWLAEQSGPVGARASAYRDWRWGDPYLRLVRHLCDRRRASVDVGAYVGSYTWFLRRYSTHCIVFEPNPQLAAVLRQRFPVGVDVRILALSDHPGKAILQIPVRSSGPDPGRATIESDNLLTGASAILDEMEVEIVTLDQAIDEPIGFIKIDVEGHELKVLQGAERVLREHQPNMILELEDRHNPGIVAAAFAYLGERGYHGWFLEADRVVPISAFQPERYQNAEHPEWWVNNFAFSTDRTTGDRLRL